MKLNLNLLLLILLCSCGSIGPDLTKDGEKIIDIIDAKYFMLNKFSFHKDKEVKVYYLGKYLPEKDNPGYGFYANKKGVKASAYFVCWGHNKYDKAAYKWVNDSIIKIRLFNITNNISDNYTYTYSSHSQSLGIDSN